MSDLKLRRLNEHNQRLKEDLSRPRLRVSEASAGYVLILLSFPLPLSSNTNEQVDKILHKYKRSSRSFFALCPILPTILTIPIGPISLGSTSESRRSIRPSSYGVQLHRHVKPPLTHYLGPTHHLPPTFVFTHTHFLLYLTFALSLEFKCTS